MEILNLLKNLWKEVDALFEAIAIAPRELGEHKRETGRWL